MSWLLISSWPKSLCCSERHLRHRLTPVLSLEPVWSESWPASGHVVLWSMSACHSVPYHHCGHACESPNTRGAPTCKNTQDVVYTSLDRWLSRMQLHTVSTPLQLHVITTVMQCIKLHVQEKWAPSHAFYHRPDIDTTCACARCSHTCIQKCCHASFSTDANGLVCMLTILSCEVQCWSEGCWYGLPLILQMPKHSMTVTSVTDTQCCNAVQLISFFACYKSVPCHYLHVIITHESHVLAKNDACASRVWSHDRFCCTRAWTDWFVCMAQSEA